MYVYQEEEGQVGLIFGIVLQKKDLHSILTHNPVNFSIGPLKINISFCEPSKPVEFDTERGVYFISLCFQEVRFLKAGNSLVAIHLIEGVRFTLMIFLESNRRDSERGLVRRMALHQYMLLRGSTLTNLEEEE